MAYTNGNRYNNEPSNGGEAQMYFREIQTPAYAASVKITKNDPRAEITKILFAKLTGDLTLTADVAIPFDGDEMIVKMPVDSSTRTVTFSTGLTVVGGATLALTTGTVGVISFMFDGTTQTWVEQSRAIN